MLVFPGFRLPASIFDTSFDNDKQASRGALMWRTQYGERTLEGAEAIVFAEALLKNDK